MTLNYDRKIILIVSLITTIALNFQSLLVIESPIFEKLFWRFNLSEFIFFLVINFIFCVVLGFLNEYLFSKNNFKRLKKITLIVILNLLVYIFFFKLSVYFQSILVPNIQNATLKKWSFFLRFLIIMGIMLFLIEILHLNKKNRVKDKENQDLKNQNLQAEIQLLKSQIDPHFLFNTLSSLSSIVRENQSLAQDYISHLSKIYRYRLGQDTMQWVMLQDEIGFLNSFFYLHKMRLEDKIELSISIENEFLITQILSFSLQPLIENAIKHNIASKSKPLQLSIFIENNKLIVSNNLNLKKTKPDGYKIGLSNLNNRYLIQFKKPLEIEQNENSFIVKIPLKYE